MIDTLKRLFFHRWVPKHLRSDNGPEFVARSVRHWLHESGCGTIFIKPGSPWANAYIESFNGKFRDECLNMEVFRSGREAQVRPAPRTAFPAAHQDLYDCVGNSRAWDC